MKNAGYTIISIMYPANFPASAGVFSCVKTRKEGVEIINPIPAKPFSTINKAKPLHETPELIRDSTNLIPAKPESINKRFVGMFFYVFTRAHTYKNMRLYSSCVHLGVKMTDNSTRIHYDIQNKSHIFFCTHILLCAIYLNLHTRMNR